MAMISGNGRERVDARDLLTFPCRIDVKAVGRHNARFEALVHSIVSKHIPKDGLLSSRSRASSGGKYLAVTLTINADNRAQLDKIYSELSRCKDVLIAL